MGALTKYIASFTVALFVTSCQLPGVAGGVCGNFVVEDGESCDGETSEGLCGAPGDAAECQFICTSNEDCPNQGLCSAAGTCSAPTFEFEMADNSWSQRGGFLAVEDFNGDGIDDVVSLDASRISLRYGSAEDILSEAISQIAPSQTTQPTLSDIDQDGRMDLVVPTAGGLQTLVGQQNGFDTFPYGSIAMSDVMLNGETVQAPLAFPVHAGDPQNHEIMLVYKSESTVFVGFADSATNIKPPLLGEGELQGASRYGQSTGELFLGEVGQPGISVVRATSTSSLAIQKLTTEPPNSMQPEMSVVRCCTLGEEPDPVLADTQRYVVSALVENSSGFPVVLKWFRYNGTNNYIGPEYFQSSSQYPLFHDDDFTVNSDSIKTKLGEIDFELGYGWLEAQAIDLNNDGATDFVARGEVDGLDVLINTGANFHRFFVPLDEVPRSLSVGDFNGDLLDDVAFYIKGDTTDSVMALFGEGVGVPSNVDQIAQLENILQLELLDSSQSTDIDTIDDLLVVTENTRRNAIILTGTTSKRMSAAYLFPSEDVIIDSNPYKFSHVPWSSSIGRFDDAGDELDAIVFGTRHTGGRDPNDSDIFDDDPQSYDFSDDTLWRIAGAGNQGQLDDASSTYRRVIEELPDEHFLSFCAQPVVTDLNNDGINEIFSVDYNLTYLRGNFFQRHQDIRKEPVSSKAAFIDLQAGTNMSIVELDEQQWLGVRRVIALDFDSDGDQEILAQFAGGIVTDTDGSSGGNTGDPIAVGQPGLVLFENNQGIPEFDFGVPFEELVDIATMTYRDRSWVVVVAGGALHFLELQAGSFVEVREPIPLTMVVRSMRTGDVNGDGLPDIVLSSHDDAFVLLHVRG